MLRREELEAIQAGTREEEEAGSSCSPTKIDQQDRVACAEDEKDREEKRQYNTRRWDVVGQKETGRCARVHHTNTSGGVHSRSTEYGVPPRSSISCGSTTTTTSIFSHIRTIAYTTTSAREITSRRVQSSSAERVSGLFAYGRCRDHHQQCEWQEGEQISSASSDP